MRTVLLVLVLWLIIYVATIMFKYVVGPLVTFVFINILLRGWNFFVLETIQEWIYIRHYSRGSTKFSGLYLRLTDRVKHNRARLSYNDDNKIIRRERIRRLGNQMMIAAGLIVALWVAAFGINQEYTTPAWVASGGAHESNAQDDTPPIEDTTFDTNDKGDNNEDYLYEDEHTHGHVRPGLFAEGAAISFVLAGEAMEGARLRSGPGTADTVVIQMLYGDDLLTYLGYYVADADVDTLYWIRVRSQSGAEGYIASHLVEVVAG